MKNMGLIIGVAVLCLIKATLVYSIWITVVGALSLTSVARVFYVWCNRSQG